MRPGPLYDSMHALARATGCLSLRQPDRAQDVCAVSAADRIELAIAQLGEDVGFERFDLLRSVLLVLPARFQLFVDLSGGLFERKSCGGNGCYFPISVSLVDRIFSVIDELAHGKRFVPSLGNGDFWIGTESCVPAFAGHGAGEA